MTALRPRRLGVTLIELLVVIGIMGFLLALTTGIYLTLGSGQQITSGADQVQGWLLSARQMARRDSKPTGIQFVVGTDGFCREARYIQQPDDFAIGLYMGPNAGNLSQARLRLGVNLTNDPQAFPVVPGDYLEVYGGGVSHQILRIDADTATPGDYLLTLLPPTSGGSSLVNVAPQFGAGAATNYRIIPQPRPISNEPPLKLNQGVSIDFNAKTWNNNTALSNPPGRSILFGPSGAVIGQGTTSGMIFLWMRLTRDNGQPFNDVDRMAGKPILVTIQTRSGFIAAHPVYPTGNDPYRFARDGRASGM